jgi:hypothetical protein
LIPLGPITSSAGTTYTALQVLQMLEGPSLRMRWFYDLLSAQFQFKGDLTPLVQTPLSTPSSSPPAIAHDHSRAVMRQMTFRMRASSLVNVLQDLVRVRYEILAPDGGWLDWIIGTFEFTPPVKEIHEGYTLWSVTAPDLSQLLADASLGNSGSTPMGANYISAIGGLAASYGGLTSLTTTIPDLGLTLPSALPYALGDSYLKTINALLGAIVYTPVWVDGNILSSQPVPDYSQVTPVMVFDTVAGQAQVMGPFSDTPDYSNAFNVFVVTGQDPNRKPVSARYENHRADSPISIENWGRVRLKAINDSTLHSNDACDRRAKAEAQLASRIYSNLGVATVPFPFLGDLDVITLAYQTTDEGLVRRNFVVVAGTHTCWASTPTTGVLQRVVAA